MVNKGLEEGEHQEDVLLAPRASQIKTFVQQFKIFQKFHLDGCPQSCCLFCLWLFRFCCLRELTGLGGNSDSLSPKHETPSLLSQRATA